MYPVPISLLIEINKPVENQTLLMWRQTEEIFYLYWCLCFEHLQRQKLWFNTLRPGQDGCHFPDDIFKCIFLNENVWIFITISQKFVPKGWINNIPALVLNQWWSSLLTHICVTRPQWVKTCGLNSIKAIIFQITHWIVFSRIYIL